MGRKNSPSERERELQNLIAQYEAVKAKNESLYLDGDQLADIADLYASERKFKEAQEVITYGLGLHPGHTDLMVEQAYLFLDLNHPQKAKEVAELITDTYSSNVKLLLAELLLNEGKLDAADQMLDRREKRPGHPGRYCLPVHRLRLSGERRTMAQTGCGDVQR